MPRASQFRAKSSDEVFWHGFGERKKSVLFVTDEALTWPWVGVECVDKEYTEKPSIALVCNFHTFKSFSLKIEKVFDGIWRKGKKRGNWRVLYNSEWATMCQTRNKMHNQCHTSWKMWQPSVIYLIIVVQTAGWWGLGLARRKYIEYSWIMSVT